MRYLITPKSSNAKTGPIMVSTSTSDTCPSACPFKANGCYASGGPLRALWDGLDKTDAGNSFKNGSGNVSVKSHAELLKAIKAQSEGAIWRHNQAGDLPGAGNEIDTAALAEIVDANRGRNGFTYTHKPMDTARNRKAVQNANAEGFTINLSGNSLEHADQLADLQIAPVVTVLPHDATANTETPKGRKVVLCPATQRDDISCATCKLCSRQRDVIVGFPAHGYAKIKVSRIVSK